MNKPNRKPEKIKLCIYDNTVYKSGAEAEENGAVYEVYEGVFKYGDMFRFFEHIRMCHNALDCFGVFENGTFILSMLPVHIEFTVDDLPKITWDKLWSALDAQNEAGYEPSH